jgi:hypothetical protein
LQIDPNHVLLVKGAMTGADSLVVYLYFTFLQLYDFTILFWYKSCIF